MFKDTKIELKTLAVKIRDLKDHRPMGNRGGKDIWTIDSEISNLKYIYRHTHIAYCELRGRTRDEIERPSENNKANQTYIDQIKNRIVKAFEDKKKEENLKNSKVYVLVRKDLERSSPAVQSGHALAEFCLNSKLSKEWNNHTLIYLQVPDLEKLEEFEHKFKEKEIEVSTFFEPDLNNQLTAICGLVNIDESGFLKELKLLE